MSDTELVSHEDPWFENDSYSSVRSMYRLSWHWEAISSLNSGCHPDPLQELDDPLYIWSIVILCTCTCLLVYCSKNSTDFCIWLTSTSVCGWRCLCTVAKLTTYFYLWLTSTNVCGWRTSNNRGSLCVVQLRTSAILCWIWNWLPIEEPWFIVINTCVSATSPPPRPLPWHDWNQL